MENRDRAPGRDAVCFTAGPKGAPFAAGVIHSYLAADRPAPKAVAGISTGALSAAALERVYRELQKGSTGDREASRWSWFRRYLDMLSHSPLDVIWNAIPDPVDFFANKPPVADLSARALPTRLQREETEARQNYFRLVKLGVWLSGLRVSVCDVAKCVVSYVRFRERYGYWFWQGVLFLARCGVITVKLFLHLAFAPKFVIERRKSTRWLPFPRPLFGWPAWLVIVAITLNAFYLALKETVKMLGHSRLFYDWLTSLSRGPFQGAEGSVAAFLTHVEHVGKAMAVYDSHPLQLVVLILALAAVALGLALLHWPGGPLKYLFGELGIARGLLHRYTLHRKLFELFRQGPFDQEGPIVASPPSVSKADRHGGRGFPRIGSMHMLLASAPLQNIPDLVGQQVWAAPGTPLVDALLAALAAPGLFSPVRIDNPDEIKQWISEDRRRRHVKRLDLIDGSVVRQNPLPALFSWLRAHRSVAEDLLGEGEHDAGIHLVYNVPTEPYDADPAKTAQERVDVVTAAFASLELAKRRDTKLEARQTNFISELELWIRKTGAASGSPPRDGQGAFPIFADEIAPETEITFGNSLAPDREGILKIAANGCRRSLETLYRIRLKDMSHGGEGVDCADLLREVAPARSSHITPEAPGLPEICRQCTRKLVHRPLHQGEPPCIRAEEFPNLSADRARIVFVASGGVFRGAFHIGVIAAMQAAKIRPNLVIGASVGALMGGALSAISSLEGVEKARLLGELCLTFLHVDARVALTKTLKNATKQLGVRAIHVHLSPAKLRRAVRRGTRADAGYAVCGAPPALIDAISSLFLIPHDDTRDVASQFIAGHITKAMTAFWSKVRQETLKRLDIEFSVMGTTLIENAARTLLGDGHGNIRLDREQPYHDEANPQNSISFFSTTSDLNRRRALLLPRDVRSTGSYDFVKAGLSSSAFPAVFSPRQEAEVLPGRGATDVLFSDGGMFDNLPFFPALEVLSSAQKHYREQQGQTAREALAIRATQPDLFLAAALDTEAAPPGEADNVIEIWRRSRTLNTNVKLDSFHATSQLVSRQIGRLLQATEGCEADPDLDHFIDKTVQTAVLKIAPANREHINGTFACCSALGLKRKRVMKSIADGCFQTLRGLHTAQTTAPGLPLRSSADHLRNSGRMGAVTLRPAGERNGKSCPFYAINGESFECPFMEAAAALPQDKAGERRELAAIYKTCVDDRDHVIAPEPPGANPTAAKPARKARNRNGRSAEPAAPKSADPAEPSVVHSQHG